MLLEETHIEKIRADFAKMQSKDDLLNLLNDVKPLIYGKKTVPFELKQLTYYTMPKIKFNSNRLMKPADLSSLGISAEIEKVGFDKTHTLDIPALNKLALTQRPDHRYKTFYVKKKSGNLRTIHAPKKGLKAIQKTLAVIFQCVFEPHNAAMGFAKGRSIVDNARLHEGSNYVYNIDVKDFFPSVDQARVWKCMQLKPFNLIDDPAQELDNRKKANSGIKQFTTEHDEKIFYRVENNTVFLIYDRKGNFRRYEERLYASMTPIENNSGEKKSIVEYLREKNEKEKTILTKDVQRYINIEKVVRAAMPSRKTLANMIASLCCTAMEVERKNANGEWEPENKNVLPQGAPTSPIITNIVCQRLDHLLSGVAKRFGLKYSRYADDMTFSSLHNVYQPGSEFLKELKRIIAEQNFHIRDEKTRLQKKGYRQEVTGLLVNEKTNVQKRYIKQVRIWLYYWERYGYERAHSFFLQQYLADKVKNVKGTPDMGNVICGKLDYLKMVKGDENKLYLKLKWRFDSLTGSSKSCKDMVVQIPKEKDLQNTLIKLLAGIKTQSQSGEKNTPILSNPTVKKANHSIQIIHNPKDLVDFLKNFSINDSALKYTTHSWDAGRDAGIFKDIEDFLSKARNEYSEFSYQLKELSENLNGKIYNFLFNKEISKKGWGINRIKFGWSSPEILSNCNLNPNLKPEDIIIPEEYQMQITGKTLQKFKHVIDVFKNEIEIRDENSALLNLILQKHDTFLLSFADPIISNLDNKTFYTDVQWLSKALDMIFDNIQTRPQHRYVSYSLNDERKDVYVLEIVHIDSFNTGKSIHDQKLQLVKGNFGDICKYLKNLCDWSIESQFSEGCYRINYLTSSPEAIPHQKLETAVGFKHILTFYK